MLKAHLLLVDGDPVSLGVLVGLFPLRTGHHLSSGSEPGRCLEDAAGSPGKTSIS